MNGGERSPRIQSEKSAWGDLLRTLKVTIPSLAGHDSSFHSQIRAPDAICTFPLKKRRLRSRWGRGIFASEEAGASSRGRYSQM